MHATGTCTVSSLGLIVRLLTGNTDMPCVNISKATIADKVRGRRNVPSKVCIVSITTSSPTVTTNVRDKSIVYSIGKRGVMDVDTCHGLVLALGTKSRVGIRKGHQKSRKCMSVGFSIVVRDGRWWIGRTRGRVCE